MQFPNGTKQCNAATLFPASLPAALHVHPSSPGSPALHPSGQVDHSIFTSSILRYELSIYQTFPSNFTLYTVSTSISAPQTLQPVRRSRLEWGQDIISFLSTLCFSLKSVDIKDLFLFFCDENIKLFLFLKKTPNGFKCLKRLFCSSEFVRLCFIDKGVASCFLILTALFTFTGGTFLGFFVPDFVICNCM